MPPWSPPIMKPGESILASTHGSMTWLLINVRSAMINWGRWDLKHADYTMDDVSPERKKDCNLKLVDSLFVCKSSGLLRIPPPLFFPSFVFTLQIPHGIFLLKNDHFLSGERVVINDVTFTAVVVTALLFHHINPVSGLDWKDINLSHPLVVNLLLLLLLFLLAQIS